MVTQSTVLPPSAAEFVVHEWIGVEQGQLLEFTHSELTAFFRRYTDLPDSHPGVLNDAGPLGGYGTPKRTRLIEALDHGSARQQIAILEGLLQRLPIEPSKGRTPEKADRIRAWISDLRLSLQTGGVDVEYANRPIPEVAREALQAARAHMAQDESRLALDRIHTALHASVRRLAQEIGVDVSKKKGLQEQFAEIRRSHAAFRVPQGERVTASIMRGTSRILEGLNLGRNDYSLAHPTDALLEDPEAKLACNVGMSVLQYILDRVEEHEARVPALVPETPKTPAGAGSNALHDPFASFDWASADSHADAVTDRPFE